MVKVGGRDLSLDQGINLYIGAGALADGAMRLFSPDQAHKQYLQAGSADKMMTRLSGAYLGAVAASQFTAGLNSSQERNKTQLKIVAGMALASAVVGAMDWKQGGSFRSDRVKACTVIPAAHSALCAWRGFR